MSKSRMLLMCALFSLLSLSTSSLHAAARPSLNQRAILTPTNSVPLDWFGFSIAISGNTVAVGDFDANIENSGAVYIYVRPKGAWRDMTQVAILTPSDGGEGFGTSVSISGNTVVVGAANTSNFESPAAGPGAAYVFVRPSAGWSNMTETAKLTASDGQPVDAFGNSVSISKDTIAVGAFFTPDHSNNDFAGKAYVFVRPAAGWAGNLHETAELTATDSQFLNYMGCSIATNGKTVVAGAFGNNNFQGAGYVFVKPPTGWASMTQTAQLTASDGKSSVNVGFSTAMSGDSVVLGAPGAAGSRGAAYVFVKPQSGWTDTTETAKLHAANATAGDGFGQSAASSNDKVIVIGAPGAAVGANQGQGAAYAFVKPVTGWTSSSHAREITALDGVGNDNFGLSVGATGATVVVGAIGNSNPGEAYVFVH